MPRTYIAASTHNKEISIQNSGVMKKDKSIFEKVLDGIDMILDKELSPIQFCLGMAFTLAVVSPLMLGTAEIEISGADQGTLRKQMTNLKGDWDRILEQDDKQCLILDANHPTSIGFVGMEKGMPRTIYWVGTFNKAPIDPGIRTRTIGSVPSFELVSCNEGHAGDAQVLTSRQAQQKFDEAFERIDLNADNAQPKPQTHGYLLIDGQSLTVK